MPASESRKIFGPLKFFRNVEYAIIEKSLLILALGLKNAGSLGGELSTSASLGTRSFVFPSTISARSVSNSLSYLKMI